MEFGKNCTEIVVNALVVLHILISYMVVIRRMQASGRMSGRQGAGDFKFKSIKVPGLLISSWLIFNMVPVLIMYFHNDEVIDMDTLNYVVIVLRAIQHTTGPVIYVFINGKLNTTVVQFSKKYILHINRRFKIDGNDLNITKDSPRLREKPMVMVNESSSLLEESELKLLSLIHI